MTTRIKHSHPEYRPLQTHPLSLKMNHVTREVTLIRIFEMGDLGDSVFALVQEVYVTIYGLVCELRGT